MLLNASPTLLQNDIIVCFKLIFTCFRDFLKIVFQFTRYIMLRAYF
nr:MAG TPA: hypothetical protein [Microviridae sp.]